MRHFLFACVCFTAAGVCAGQAAPPIPSQELAEASAKKPVTVEIKPACYTQAQYRAEQAVRYQTQLMVAGMLCQQRDPKSYSNYQAFTQRNQKTINRAEDVLMGFFREHKTPQAELSLHTMRTNMANDISIKAMGQSVNIYCPQAITRLRESAGLQPRQFETYLTKLDLRQSSTRPLCPEAKTASVIPINTTTPTLGAIAKMAPASGMPTPVSPAKSSDTLKPSQPQKDLLARP